LDTIVFGETPRGSARKGNSHSEQAWIHASGVVGADDVADRTEHTGGAVSDNVPLLDGT